MRAILEVRGPEVVKQAAFVGTLKCNIIPPALNKAPVVTNYVRVRPLRALERIVDFGLLPGSAFQLTIKNLERNLDW